MPSVLTPNDISVLEKMRDPESAAAPILIDKRLPSDPNLKDPGALAAATAGNQKIMNDVLALEKKENEQRKEAERSPDPALAEQELRKSMISKWLVILIKLDTLITQFPNFAQARGNRVQVLRLIYGDAMLVKLWAETIPTEAELQQNPQIAIKKHQYRIADEKPGRDTYAGSTDLTMERVSSKALCDLTRGIVLLNPRTPFGGMSPQQAMNLANLYMLRGTLYQAAAKKLSKNGIFAKETTTATGTTIQNVTLKAEFRVKEELLEESSWDHLDFQEHASRDYMMAGRYGSPIGKALAVAMNPTAKLCGAILKEAMRKEYTGDEVA